MYEIFILGEIENGREEKKTRSAKKKPGAKKKPAVKKAPAKQTGTTAKEKKATAKPKVKRDLSHGKSKSIHRGR
jgi:hypothetical protein